MMKLASWIDYFDHYELFFILCDDQLIIVVQIEQVVFENFGVLF